MAGRRVPEHLAAVGRVGGHYRDGGVVVDRAVEVDPLAVDPGGERVLREAFANGGGDFGGRRTRVVFALRSVRQRDLHLVGHLPGDDTSGPLA